MSLIAILGFCAFSDIRSNRIPNNYIIAGIGYSLVCSLLESGPGATALMPLIYMLTVIILLFPFYLIGKLGAGDIKLLGIIAAFTSPGAALISLVISLYICLIPIGLVLVKRKSLRGMRLPLAAPIMIGTVIRLFVLNGVII